jgi:hypothetical protein
VSKQKDKGQKNAGLPDESFSAPGMSMERYGRFMVARTHRSPEQQADLERQLWEGRPHILEKLGEATSELCEIINRYESFDIVSNLFLRNCLHNSDKYVEYKSHLRPHFVEHAAILELKNPQFRQLTKMPEPIDGQDLDRAQELLEEIFQGTVWYYIAEGAGPDHSGQTRLGELRFMTLLHGMAVRSPAYTQHWQAVLSGLSECSTADSWLKSTRGYGFQQAVKFANGIESIITTLLQMRMKQAREAIREFETEFPIYRRRRNLLDHADKNAFYEQLCELPAKSAKQQFQLAMVSWICFGLPFILSFPPSVLAEAVQEEEKAAAAFLEDLSLRFGSTPADYVLPSPANALHERPLITYDNKYFCPVPHLLEWAVKPRLEELLNEGPVWESYNRHRAALLIEMGLACFRKMLSGAKAYTNLFYPTVGGGEAELDALVLFDRYAFLIEGKAGAFGDAKRGGKQRIVKQLNQLVGDAAAQARRAYEYLTSTDEPEFRLKGGGSVRFNSRTYSQIAEVTLSLDSLDIYTADLGKLRDLGVLGSSELPWAVSLTDLMAISEVISRPSEFIHFLRWRQSVNEDPKVAGMIDELNWLAVYYREGPAPPSAPAGTSWLTFTNYLEHFDNFFLSEAGQRTEAVPRPSQHLPQPVERLIAAFETSAKLGFTEATEFLYGLGKSDRDRLSSSLRSFMTKGRKGRVDVMTFETSYKVIRLWAKAEEGPAVKSEASRLCASMRKEVLVALLDFRIGLEVQDWYVSIP